MNNKLKSGIYKITNIVNKKVYIGSASFLNKRKGNHFDKLKTNKHYNKKLQNAFNKYGNENFIWELIEYCEKSNLITREQYYLDTILFAQEYIRKENKKFEELGYNISPLASSRLGVKCSEETKNKLRELKLKQGKLPPRKFTTEQKKFYSNQFKKLHKEKRIPPRSYTKEQKEEKSEFMKNRYKQGLESPLKNSKFREMGILKRLKSVLQLDLNDNFIKEYKSATDAAKQLNISNKPISGCCTGEKKTYRGFKWRFK